MCGISSVQFSSVVRSTEGKKLLRDEPVEVAILNALVVLILVDVKVLEVKKSRLPSFVDGTQCVQDGDGIVSVAPGSIPDNERTKNELEEVIITASS